MTMAIGTELRSHLLHGYWDAFCDPRTSGFWLMSGGPWKLILILCGYIAIIVFGKRIMQNRKAFELRETMLVYNILMVLINGYFLYEALIWVRFGARLLDFRFPSPNDRSQEAIRQVTMFNLYFWTKFVDFFDTFIFIARKKDRQVTTLHIYHHCSVPIIGWISSWISPTMPVLGLFAMLNCFCHVIMYSYYALSSLGPRIQPFLWWKKYITQVQLFQFAIIGLYGVFLQVFHNGYPLIYRMMPVSQAIIFLFMFGQFYVRSYMKRKKVL